MNIRGGKFLVIGGAGFIGSHIVDLLLAEGASLVRVYDNFSRGTRNNLRGAFDHPNFEIFSDGGDILHIDTLKRAMQDIDGVFHLAALWLLQCAEYPRSAFEVNVSGAMNVFEVAIDCGIKRLIFSSSASVYGDAIEEPIKEDHPLNCEEFYGASKVCGEMLLKALANRSIRNGGDFSYLGLRYMNVYGERQDDKGAYVGVIVRMLNDMDRGVSPTIYGDGSQSYDFVHVKDCARANLLAMSSSSSNMFVNVGTGIKTSIKELSGMLTSAHPSHLAANFQPATRQYVQTRVGSTNLVDETIGFRSKIALRVGLDQLIKYRLTENKVSYEK